MANGDDVNVLRVMKQAPVTGFTFGKGSNCNYRAGEIRYISGKTFFNMYKDDRLLGEISLSLPGEHNVINALAALATAKEEEMDWETSVQTIAEFTGAQRRMQKIGEKNNVCVYVDYAHHPTEVRETLKGLKNINKNRLITVLQPHLYSRTLAMADDFAEALKIGDKIFVTEVFASRETNAVVSGNLLVGKLKEKGKTDATFVAKVESLPQVLAEAVNPGDIVVLMGAGDINEYASPLLEALK